MSATSTADPSPGTAGGSGAGTCAFCGAHLDPEQEWCLECGVARTIVHRPPDWRIPLAVVGTLVILAIAGFVVVLATLNDGGPTGGSRRASGTTTPATHSSATHSPATHGAAAAAGFRSWPPGLSGWAVFLATEPTRSAATARARQLSAGGVSAGVIDSSQHPRLAPGQWIVFSGRYPTGTGAQAAAAALQAKGYPAASAREVAPPGGI